jgi:predicted N-acetyltransferase YhbS
MVGGWNMFIKEFKIQFVENSRISDNLRDKVICLKQDYWDYSYELHIKWMKENIHDDEYHLIIMDSNDEIVAYLNIINTCFIFNDISEEVMGIGNVSVRKSCSGQGIGRLLMCVSNYYFESFGKRAMLLCKPHLIKFYEKCGWIKYEGEVCLKDKKYEGTVMFTKYLNAPKILIEREF